MKFAEELEVKLNEIQEEYDKDVAEIMAKIATVKANKEKASEECELYIRLGYIDEYVTAKNSMDVYNNLLKVYQEQLTAVQGKVLITSSEYSKYIQEIKKTYSAAEVSLYEKIIDHLEETRKLLYEITQLNHEAHGCVNMISTVAHYSNAKLDYLPMSSFNREFYTSDYITNPLGFSVVGAKNIFERCCHDNDLFAQLKLQIKNCKRDAGQAVD